MRNAFANQLFMEMQHDKRIMLLTGDLGYSVFEPIIDALPQQYINCGLTEQSMTGIAAGLASEGFIPVLYSIIPFITMRNYEQIRNDICYQNLPVKIVGVGAGFSYGPYGHTHHGLEDIAIMRVLANMQILAPGDPFEATELTKYMVRSNHPTYLRIGKKGEPTIHPPDSQVIPGKASLLHTGKDLVILATSTMLETANLVVAVLHDLGVNAKLYSVHTLKPFDTAIVTDNCQIGKFVTIEEHSLIGGLGSIVSEIIAQQALSVRLLALGVNDKFTPTIGTQEHMRAANGLGSQQIVQRIMTVFYEGKGNV
jgi:transketolase